MEFDRESLEWAKMHHAADREKFRQQIAFAKKWAWRLYLLPFFVIFVLMPFRRSINKSVGDLLAMLALVPGLWVYLRLDSWKLRIRRAEDELRGVISVGDKFHRDWKQRMVYAIGSALYIACAIALAVVDRRAAPWVAFGAWVCTATIIFWNTKRMIDVD